MNKQCSMCKEIKDLSDFNLDKYLKDGHKSYCRDCQKDIYIRDKKKIKQRNHNLYLSRRRQHRCVKCNIDLQYFVNQGYEQSVLYKSRCPNCLLIDKQHTMKRSIRKRQQGLCIYGKCQCPPLDGYVHCREHVILRNKQSRMNHNHGYDPFELQRDLELLCLTLNNECERNV